MRDDLPTGTVTFLFTDVEGSTRLLHALGAEAYADALAEHRRVIREACGAHGGVEVDTQGDAFFFGFPTAPGALGAANEVSQALESGPIRVRIGLHTGTPYVGDEGYIGGHVHRAARIAAAGHGGQVLVSASTAQLVDLELTDLGEHRLKDLSAAERIFQLGEHEFPPLKSLYRTNLPIPATPFLGRERELTEVVSLLTDTRLLTLTGPGGTGKTRLALQAVAASAEDYPDGVFWVPLAPLRDPELVLQRASRALGAKNGLSEHIQDKRLLVLFDNFEQVTAAAPGLSDLLAVCPSLQLVVTSREPLHLAAEQEYPVPPFAHDEGVGFFIAKARATEPSFKPDESVSEICRRLDELPLALELAAARVKALSTTQILERLEHRLPLLTGGSRDAPERQRTLRATIEWSYELLSEDEQRLFARLAVFRGGCTLDAAEDVCQAGLDTLQSLVSRSLLRFSNERYWMLETIREYASELLAATADAAGLAQAHAEYCLTLAQAAALELEGSAQAAWLDRLDAEHDNLRTALDWSIESGHRELGLRIAVSLRRFWEARGPFEEAKRYLQALNSADQPPELQALALRDLVFITGSLNELDESERLADERRQLCLRLGDTQGARRALQNLGIIADLRGDFDRARAIYEEVLSDARKEGDDVHEIGIPLHNLGSVAWKQGRLTDAETLYEESLAAYEEGGNNAQIAHSCSRLGGVLLYQGRLDEALPLLRRAVHLDHELRTALGLANDFECIALASSDPRTAARLLGAGDELRDEVGDRVPHVPSGPYERAVAMATEALGQEAFDQAYDEGRAMDVDDAFALALEVVRA